jgi:nucleoside-diphosphate-sugar epimerase
MSLDNKKVVVTGGAGFIGSNLVGKLVGIVDELIVIDDLSTGRKENLSEYKDKITFIEGSVVDIDLLQETFHGVDVVFHQAAIPSVPRSVEYPLKTNEVNITGTLNVFIAARDNDVSRVVYACSSSTYGDEVSLPASEESPLNPLSPYAVQKAAKEMYGKVFLIYMA